MSKLYHLFVPGFLALLLAGSAHPGSVQAPLAMSIRVEIGSNKTIVRIEGEFMQPRRTEFRRNFSLPNFPSTRKLDQMQFRDEKGEVLSHRQLAPGEYIAERDIKRWSYAVDLTSPGGSRSLAHETWISADGGLLMPRDYWPSVDAAHDQALLNLKLPEGWEFVAMSSVSEPPENTSKVSDVGTWMLVSERTVLPIGKAWRTKKSGDVDIYASGSWHFSDDEVSAMATEIFRAYGKLFGPVSTRPRIILARFPGKIGPGEWDAETRGDTVTIVSSDMPFRTQSVQRLHEQLRHELFHLWIPNDVNLAGNYDWFYEGFALYQSLKLAVALNRIRFEDFLDTLSRAHTLDSAFTQRPSLLEASKNRFSGLNTQVYARGILVGFLTDLALIERSKSSVEDLLRTIYRNHRKPTAVADGNEAIIGLMKRNTALEPVVRKYIAGSEAVDWKSDLSAAGIEDIDPGPITTLRVMQKLNGRQKTLLDKLGYNNWRKLTPNSK